jgi:hypothetical protein
MRAVTNKSNTAYNRELKLTIRAVYIAYDKRGTVYNKRSTVHRTSSTDKSSISIFKTLLNILIRTIAISGDPVADGSLQGNPVPGGCGAHALKKKFRTHVIKLDIAPMSYPPGQYLLVSALQQHALLSQSMR